MTNSKFIKHESCPVCGSSDALARYSDGSAHCFSAGCNHHENGNGEVVSIAEKRPLEFNGATASIPERRITQATCAKFGVTVEFDRSGKISRHHYPYYAVDTNEVKGSKVRIVQNKDFYATGSLQGVGLFGQNTCRGRGKFITITEGELDALSVSEMFDNKWDVVSLRSGASAAAKEIKEQL